LDGTSDEEKQKACRRKLDERESSSILKKCLGGFSRGLSESPKADGKSFAPRVIRALPFEPLVHQRNLPNKEGIISPLRFNDYYAKQKQATQCLDDDDKKSPSPRSRSRSDSIDSTPPPVEEIRIPTPQQPLPGETARNAEDYKTLYFCSQKELHEAKQQLSNVTEENRLLKRRLIQMQRDLFAVTRNKRRAVEGTTAGWSVPGEEENKKQRPSSVTPNASKEYEVRITMTNEQGTMAAPIACMTSLHQVSSAVSLPSTKEPSSPHR
jgi:hypothetical protein